MNVEFISAIQELGKEKGIDSELLFRAIEEALVSAYKKNFKSKTNACNAPLFKATALAL